MDFKNFAPSWFASVMGIGGLAMVSVAYSNYFKPLNLFGVALTYLNTILFFVLLIPWTLRWLKFRENAEQDLKHPMTGHFYGTIAVAILVLSGDYLYVLHQFALSFYFWVVGVLMTIFFAFLIPYLMFINKTVDMKNVTPAWFIPPVGLIVIPLSGGAYMHHFTGLLGELIVMINYFAWSSGFFLYIALFALVMHRMIMHEPMPCGMAPSIWINLGPIGVGTSTLVILATHSSFLGSGQALLSFALILWGFGIWWFFMAVIMTVHYMRNLNLPYSLAWWAFIFPLAAYVSGTHSIATVFHLELVSLFGFALYWLLVALLAITSWKTVVHFVKK
ncbi:MAG: C4-dicarboxylate ABC transporter [Euryarchaeota archaeon]|nr:C4-dicarboxylate ABC transporter [Euryarchaeota archaeon]